MEKVSPIPIFLATIEVLGNRGVIGKAICNGIGNRGK